MASLSLWSFFSNQDRISSLNNIDQAATTSQVANELNIVLPPLPTLVPVDFTTEQQALITTQPLSVQNLRSVSAPVVAVPSGRGPLVVTGSNRSNSGPVTSTGSS